jgi:nickel-dependent lactate racemase
MSSLLAKAFRGPCGDRMLKGVLRHRKRALVVVTDDTRNAHLKTILPELLRRMDDGRREIKIIVATGLHKTHTEAQSAAMLGDRIMKKYRVLSHRIDKDHIVDAGRTRRGVPITLDANIFEADAVLSVGTIEPHLYAGYSGGAKTIGVGLAGEATVNDTHGVRFLDDPGVAIGSVDRNPFQETLWEAADRAGLAFSVNVVNGQDGGPAAVFCGPPREVFKKGVAFARRVYEVTAKEPADIAICGIGYPKDVNLYQASRAINYVANVDRPVLKKGGVLIVAAEMRDGPGKSSAELKFYETLRAIRDPRSFIDKVKRRGCGAGEHRAYMVAGPLADYRIVFVTGARQRFMDGLPFKRFTAIHAALEYARTLTGPHPKTCVIPHSLATIARIKR